MKHLFLKFVVNVEKLYKVSFSSADSVGSKPGTKFFPTLPHNYDLIKRCHIVSDINGFDHLLDKADKKLCSSGRNGL